jgi:hypothetical protein
VKTLPHLWTALFLLYTSIAAPILVWAVAHAG